jgi:hypothetical protein
VFFSISFQRSEYTFISSSDIRQLVTCYASSPTEPPAQIATKTFFGTKRSRGGVNYVTLSRVEVHLYLYSNHICAFMESYRVNLFFYFSLHSCIFI